MRNKFPDKIESARATLFLADAEGRIVSQTTRWVIGGDEKAPALSAGGTNSYYFVIITTDKPFATANVSFNRIVLQGGKLADTKKDVMIER